VRFAATRSPHDLARACARSAVFVWVPTAAPGFAAPLCAAANGCELVLARGLGAERLFGDRAAWVDPFDIDAIRAEALAAAARWSPSRGAPWRDELRTTHSPAAYGRRLLAHYGLEATAAAATAGLALAEAP
jgi:hypothetical protein